MTFFSFLFFSSILKIKIAIKNIFYDKNYKQDKIIGVVALKLRFLPTFFRFLAYVLKT